MIFERGKTQDGGGDEGEGVRQQYLLEPLIRGVWLKQIPFEAATNDSPIE